jgi:glycosyltransferase involved in cell wall biosynthesis
VESDQLSICMYTPTASGGHARYTHALLSALSEAGRNGGVRVSLVSSQDLDPRYRTSLYPIYATLPALKPRSVFRSNASWACSRIVHYYRRERAFLRWIEEHNRMCEGIHFQEYMVWLFGPRHFRLLKARGKRLFFTVHNIYPHRYLTRKINAPYSVGLSRTRTTLRLCDALFVHSESLRGQLAEFLGAGHPPIWVTPHGVWDSAGDARAATNADERVHRRRLLFFGVIRRNKGLRTLLRAMERLVDCTLTVAGPPEDVCYQQQVRAMIEQMPLGRVELIDRFIEDDEMARLFNQSSLVILPYSAFAAQSGVLHDALAYGLPVVATDVGALGESVRNWGIGQVVPPNNDAALAYAIREMLTLDHYTQASRIVDRVRTDFSWNRTAEITIEAYHSVMRDRSKVTTP